MLLSVKHFLLVSILFKETLGDLWWLGTNAFGGKGTKSVTEQNLPLATDQFENQNAPELGFPVSDCPLGFTCSQESGCSRFFFTGIQERNGNIIPCGTEKICCAIEDTQEERKSEGINADRVPFQDLPDTECPHNMKCTQEDFCDQNAFISSRKLQLTKKQKSERGELIPCFNRITSEFDVCCSVTNQTKQAVSKTSNFISKPQTKNQCPQVQMLPPTSSCEGHKSFCFDVGKSDPDCGGEVCCFDGCANVCSKSKAPRPSKVQKKPKRPFTKKTTIENKKTFNKVAKFPKVQCPSAMQCVPRNRCDFQGVISRQSVTLTAAQEAIRVPLIPCVNLQERQRSYVCCREQ